MYFVTGRAGPSDRYYAFYENVTGIKFGTGVFYEGYRVGQVEEVKPVPAPNGMRYQVHFSIVKDWRIPADSSAEVVSAGLISQMQIEIREGTSTKLLQPGDEIRGVQQVDLFSALSDAASDFSDLKTSGVAPVLRNLNKRITQVANELLAFRRDELSPFVAALDQNVNHEIAPQAIALLRRLDTSTARIEVLLSDKNVTRVEELLVHIDGAAISLNELLGNIEQTRRDVSGVVQRLDRVIAENAIEVNAGVKSARSALEKMDATLSVVREDIDTVMYHIEGSARHMHELSRALRDNPSRILRSPTPTEETR